MAIPRSKLSDLIGPSASPIDILTRLRVVGLLSEEAPDGEVLSRIQEALAEEASEHRKQGFTWASADTRIPGKLTPYLSKKGREWAIPG